MERLNKPNMESQGNSESANIDAIVSRAMADFKKDQNQDIVHETPKSKHSVIKTAGAMATAAAIGFGMTGCAEVQETPTTITEVQPSETKPSVVVTPTETSVKVDPVGTTEVVATPTPVETDVNAEALLAEMPDFEGLTKKVIDGVGTYYVEDGSLYNLESGEFAGIFNKYVSVNGKQVGGEAFVPKVLDKLVGENIEAIIPFNLKEVTEQTKLNIEDTNCETMKEYVGRDVGSIIVSFDGELTILNPYVEGNSLNTVDEFLNTFSFISKDGKTISFDSQAGLAANKSWDETRTEMEMVDFYYIFNSIDKTDPAITNFDEVKKYIQGEELPIKAKSYLAIMFDLYKMQSTNTDKMAKGPKDTVLFAYPQEAVVTETSN